MSHAYVRALFDRYAERFDEDLTIRLKYQAPQVLRAMVDRIPRIVPGGMDVLDVGCGTGLAGVASVPWPVVFTVRIWRRAWWKRPAAGASTIIWK